MGFHVGQTFGDYSITAMLGAGGMGRVYKVQHRLTNRTEAMKVLVAERATETQLKRFEREMHVLARLSHPNIAALYNAVHSEGQLILLMEFIEGQTLESILRAGRLPVRTGIEYIKQILSALRCAHQQGVVHRDVTPSNVIVTPAGQVKLTDFGLSKSFGDPLLTRGGEILGTLPYLAPEQVKHTSGPDSRSDLFSVGVILYEALTGQKPFGAERRLAPVLTDSEKDPLRPTELDPRLPPQWDDIVKRALARDLEQRYQSAAEFLSAIGQCEQAATRKIRLPYLRVASIGMATFVILALALVARPAVSRYRPVEYQAPSVELPAIPPPSFAFSTTPRYAEPSAVSRQTESVPKVDISVPESTPAPFPAADSSKKRSFWRKLNPFKRKSKEEQSPPE